MARLKRAGVLDNPLPGTFVLAADASERAWLRAVCAWSAPFGVLHTTTAASLWLPSLAGQTSVLSHPTLKSRRRIKVTRRGVPGDFVRMADGLRFATPAYAAVELAATDDGRAVCEALRRRLANPAELREALQAMNGSVGQAVRRCVVVHPRRAALRLGAPRPAGVHRQHGAPRSAYSWSDQVTEPRDAIRPQLAGEGLLRRHSERRQGKSRQCLPG